MKTILDQAIELELGDEYPEALERAKKFVGSTLNMYKRWGKHQTIVNNEGGSAAVLRNCLATIVEVGNVADGLDRWASRIADEYANGAHTKWSSIDDVRVDVNEDNLLVDENQGAPIPQDYKGIDVRPMLGYSTLGYSAASVPPEGDGLESLLGDSSSEEAPIASTAIGSGDDDKPDLALVIKTVEERELYEALAATQNLADAADLIGMEHDRAKLLNNRVWQRVRYHYGKRGYRFSATNG